MIDGCVKRGDAFTASARGRSEASGLSNRTRFLTRRGNEAALGDEGRSFPSATRLTLKPKLGLKSDPGLCGGDERGGKGARRLLKCSAQTKSLCKQLSLCASLIKAADSERQAAQHMLTGKRARAQYQLEAIQTRDKLRRSCGEYRQTDPPVSHLRPQWTVAKRAGAHKQEWAA